MESLFYVPSCNCLTGPWTALFVNIHFLFKRITLNCGNIHSYKIKGLLLCRIVVLTMPTKDFRPKCRLELSFVHEDFFKIDTHKIQRFETTVAALSRYFFKKEFFLLELPVQYVQCSMWLIVLTYSYLICRV